jgi:hypothetical protein
MEGGTERRRRGTRAPTVAATAARALAPVLASVLSLSLLPAGSRAADLALAGPGAELYSIEVGSVRVVAQ